MVNVSVAPFLSSSVTVEPNVTLFDGTSEAPGLCKNSSIPSQRDYDAVVMLNPRQLADNIVRYFKDAFNDPSLSEYARQQGIDVSDSLITPCPNTSRPISVVSKSLSSQSSKPSSSY